MQPRARNLWLLCMVVCLAAHAAHAATIVLDNESDGSMGCTLRAAVECINRGSVVNSCVNTGGVFGVSDTIQIPAVLGTINIDTGAGGLDDNVGGDIDIDERVVIEGLGPARKEITGTVVDGLIHVLPGSIVTLRNLSIRDYTLADSSGMAAVKADGPVTIDNCAFVNNVHTGVMANDRAAALIGKSTVLVVNSVFSSNICDEGFTRAAGAIFLESGTSMQVFSSTFTGNQGIFGGAIGGGANVGELFIQGSSFNANEAYYGGAVFLDTAVKLEIQNSDFNSNVADEYGGAVTCITCTETIMDVVTAVGNAAEPRIMVRGVKDDANVGSIEEVARRSARGSARGTPSVDSGSGGFAYIGYSPNAVSMQNCAFYNNRAVSSGGAVALDYATLNLGLLGAGYNVAQYGGVVASYQDMVMVTLYGGSVNDNLAVMGGVAYTQFGDNMLEGSGTIMTNGADYAGGVQFSLMGNMRIGNPTSQLYIIGNYAEYGGVQASLGTATMEIDGGAGGSLGYNYAEAYGGVAYGQWLSDVRIGFLDDIYWNWAQYGGGVIAMYSGTFLITSVDFINDNYANFWGGVVYAEEMYATSAIYSVLVLADNRSLSGFGGVVHVDTTAVGASLNFSYVETMAYNSAGANGGVVYMKSWNPVNVSFDEVWYIQGNYSNSGLGYGYGGVIYALGLGNGDSGDVSIQGAHRITSNFALGGGGGVVAVNNAQVMIRMKNDGQIGLNYGGHGGVVYSGLGLCSHTIEVPEGYIYANNGLYGGGVIFAGANGPTNPCMPVIYGASGLSAFIYQNLSDFGDGGVIFTELGGAMIDFAAFLADNSASGNGGAIAVNNLQGHDVRVTNAGEISYNTASYGGVLSVRGYYSENRVVEVVASNDIKGNAALNFGGVVFADAYAAASVSVMGYLVSNNSALLQGGVVHHFNDSVIGDQTSVVGCYIDNNSSGYGGVIYAQYVSNATVYNDPGCFLPTISGNRAVGPAYASGGVIAMHHTSEYGNARVLTYGGIISYNQVVQDGGVIYTNQGYARVYGYYGSLYGNTANRGGVVAVGVGSASIHEFNQVTDNLAFGDGGCIYIGSATVDSGVFDVYRMHQNAAQNGGVLWGRAGVSYVVFTVEADVLTGNSASSIYQGGGVLFSSNAPSARPIVFIKDYSGGTAEFGNNNAAYGGMFYCQYCIELSVSLNMGEIYDNNAQHGGVIYTRDTYNVVVTADYVNMTGNSAARAGGVIHARGFGSDVSVTADGGLVSGNTAQDGGVVYHFAIGGQLYFGNRDGASAGLEFNQNSAAYSGGVARVHLGNFAVAFAQSFIQNTATDGGVLSITHPSNPGGRTEFYVVNTISDNTAYGNGGVAAVDGSYGQDVLVHFVQNLSNNVADYGGCFYAIGRDIELSNMFFVDYNVARVDGGVIYHVGTGQSVDMRASRWEYNSATRYGGVVATDGLYAKVAGAYLEYNSAQLGGVLYRVSPNFSGDFIGLQDFTRVGANQAMTGGVMYVINADVRIENVCAIVDNQASGAGVLYVDSGELYYTEHADYGNVPNSFIFYNSPGAQSLGPSMGCVLCGPLSRPSPLMVIDAPSVNEDVYSYMSTYMLGTPCWDTTVQISSAASGGGFTPPTVTWDAFQVPDPRTIGATIDADTLLTGTRMVTVDFATVAGGAWTSSLASAQIYVYDQALVGAMMTATPDGLASESEWTFTTYLGEDVVNFSEASLLYDSDSLAVVNTVRAGGMGGVYWFDANVTIFSGTLESCPISVPICLAQDPGVCASAMVTCNEPPTLDPIGDLTFYEGNLSTVMITAMDGDSTPLTFGYNCPQCPATMVFQQTSATSYEIRWTPGELDGGSAFPLTVVVSDNEGGVDSETVMVTVVETNVPPGVISGPPMPVAAPEKQQTQFTLTSSDADVPAQTVSFRCLMPCPAGVTLDLSGLVTVVPDETQGGSLISFGVEAFDDFAPAGVSPSFLVAVNAVETNDPPQFSPLPATMTVSENTLGTQMLMATDADDPAQTLSFSCADCPSTVSVSPAGLVEVRPLEPDGGSVVVVTVVVTDSGFLVPTAVPPESTSASLTISMVETNTAPQLVGLPTAITVNEFETEQLQLVGSDVDVPVQTLRFQCVMSCPPGVTVPISGLMSVTPGETQGGTSFDVNVFVFDNGSPAMQSSPGVVTVNVIEVNAAPVMATPQRMFLDEFESGQQQLSATDSDIPTQTLSWSVAGCSGCEAVSITSTGLLSVQPGETNGGTTVLVTVTVTDNGVPVREDVRTVEVVVTETNEQPVLIAPALITVDEHETRMVMLAATDADLPAQSFTYLCVTCPSGVTLSATGALTIVTGESQGGTSFAVGVQVRDSGTPRLLSAVETITVDVTETNEVPVIAQPSAMTVNEFATGTQQLIFADSDVPSQSLTALCTSCPAFVTVTSAGLVTVSPLEVDGGTVAVVEVEVSDTWMVPGVATTSFTVTAVETNSRPTLVTPPTPMSVPEHTTAAQTLMVSDSDIPAQTLTFTCVSCHSAASVSTDGTISVTPGETDGGVSTALSIRVMDNGSPAQSLVVSVPLVMVEVNAPHSFDPIAVAYTVNEGASLTVPLSVTDPDIPQNPIAFSCTGCPANMAVGASTGTLTFTPDESQGPGVYNVNVVATDDQMQTATISLTITVREVNTAPVLGAAGPITLDELTSASVPLSFSDADLPANTLTFSCTDCLASMTVTPAGEFQFSPTEQDGPGFYGVTITVTDNGSPALSSSVTILCTVREVNVAPVVALIGNQMVEELTTLSFYVQATDSDVPQNTLTYSCAQCAPGMSVSSSTGLFSWTPTESQGPGSYDVQVAVQDNGSPRLTTTSNVFTITVSESNMVPEISLIGAKSVAEGSLLAFTVVATDYDVPSNTVSFSLTGAAAGMDINVESGAFTWRPTEAQGPGVFSVTVVVEDNGDPPRSTSETIAITVSEVNEQPLFDDGTLDAETVTEEVEFRRVVSATDVDVPANTLTYALDVQSTRRGATINAATGEVVWTPTEAQGPGSYTMTVTVSDDGSPAMTAVGSFVVTVQEANRPPVLVLPSSPVLVNEGEVVSVVVAAEDPDIPANALTYTLVTAPSALAILDPDTGEFVWQTGEADGSSEAYTVTVEVSDGAAIDSGSFTVIVAEVNERPEIAPIVDMEIDELETVVVPVPVTDADVPANTLIVTLDTVVDGVNVVSLMDGYGLKWTPSEAQGPGTYPLTVRVTDDGTPPLSSTETFVLTVNEVNTPPYFVGFPAQLQTSEGETLQYTFSAADDDIPAQPLTFVLESVLPGGGMVLDGSSGELTWAAVGEQFGGMSIMVEVTVSDGDAETTREVAVVVGEVNTPPVVQSIANVEAQEGEEIRIGVLVTDVDIPAQTISYDIATGPAGASVQGNEFVWVPTEGQAPGSYEVTIVVSDGVATDSVSFTIDVANVPPVLTGVSTLGSVDEGASRLYTLVHVVDGPDDGLGAFSYVVDWGDGTAPENGIIGGLSESFERSLVHPRGAVSNPLNVPAEEDLELEHTYANGVNEFKVIHVTVCDWPTAENSCSEFATQVRVRNVAPVIAQGPPEDAMAGEGSQVTFSPLVVFTDPALVAGVEAYTYTIRWGDGSETTGAPQVQPGGTVARPYAHGWIEGTHVYKRGQPGLKFALEVQVCDETACTVARTFVKVANSPVILTLVANETAVDEGETVTFSPLMCWTDAAITGGGETWRYEIRWGDGSTQGSAVSSSSAEGLPAGGCIVASHTYARGGEAFVVRMRVCDESMCAEAQLTVDVRDVPATLVSATGSDSVLGGDLVMVYGEYSDEALRQPDTEIDWEVDWGDGERAVSTGRVSLMGMVGDPIAGDFLATHTYEPVEQSTQFEALITVCDQDDECTGSTLVITVEPPPPPPPPEMPTGPAAPPDAGPPASAGGGAGPAPGPGSGGSEDEYYQYYAPGGGGDGQGSAANATEAGDGSDSAMDSTSVPAPGGGSAMQPPPVSGGTPTTSGGSSAAPPPAQVVNGIEVVVPETEVRLDQMQNDPVVVQNMNGQAVVQIRVPPSMAQQPVSLKVAAPDSTILRNTQQNSPDVDVKSAVVNVTLSNNQRQLDERIELCFATDSSTKDDKDKCIGFIDEETQEWKCECKCDCLDTAGDDVCGDTEHLTSFAVLIGGTGGRGTCDDEDDFITGSWGGDLALVFSVVGCFSLLACVIIVVGAYVPCARRMVRGEMSMRKLQRRDMKRRRKELESLTQDGDDTKGDDYYA